MKLLYIVLFILILIGCGENKANLISSVNSGIVVDSDIVPTSFNEAIKMTIKTKSGIFHVRGMSSIMIGAKTWIETYDSGRKYLCVENIKYCFPI